MTYDSLDRRTVDTLEYGWYWSYGYNDRNELTSAGKFWQDNSATAGQQFGYTYDNIGNRASASFGGDISGANLQTIGYTANSLNQYSSISTPGYGEVLGVALATNSVTVNGGSTDRKGEYYHAEMAVTNSGGPVWQCVSVTSGGTTTNGGLVCPANSQNLTYDLDGNLSFDGVWSYNWDGENRLLSMTMTNVGGIAATNRLKLEFAYDYLWRRVQKKVSAWNGSGSFTNRTTSLFVYDGWNLIASLNSPSSILQSFLWGQDLSGTMNGAGGVGGLLMVTMGGASTTNSFTCYDGNGNITALVNTADKTTIARYEYSPYGELIRATGLLARQIPFRFSTKFFDEETGLLYYGYRFYNPALGRWINRDPTPDQILLTLYLYCHNNPLNRFDIDGGTDWYLVGEGICDIIAGAATGLVGGLSIPATFGINTILGVGGMVAGAGLIDQGIIVLWGGIRDQSATATHEDADKLKFMSLGGGIGRLLGGKEGQDIGNYIEASVSLISAAKELPVAGKLLAEALSTQFAYNPIEWTVATDDLYAGETSR